jgi:hypothetical protein
MNVPSHIGFRLATLAFALLLGLQCIWLLLAKLSRPNLVPFFDIEQLANCVIEVLTHPRRFRSIRVQARQTILDQYDLARICLPRMMAFIQKASPGKG